VPFDLQYKLESASIYFQGGVRKSIIIFLGILLILLMPFYFFGQIMAGFWSNNSKNSQAIFYKEIFEPKNVLVSNYQIDRSVSVPLVNSETVLYTTINNTKNQTIGYFPFVYRLQVLDANKKIVYENVESTYLLPGEVKYIIANPKNDKGYDLVITKDPKTQPVLYNPQADNLAKSVMVQTRNPIVKNNPENDQLEMTALIKNNGLVEIRSLDILYIARDARDRVVGIGEKQIMNLRSSEEREISVIYPKPKYRKATRLEVRAFVNYLDKENIIVN
jgi:hypothetical protein